MPRASNGVYSLPAGNPVVTGTTIASTWANTTMADVATAMTDSLDRSGFGGMLASLQLFAGTAGSPGLSWSVETNSGLYRAGASDFRYSVAATDVIQILSTGLVISGTKTLTVGGNASVTGTFSVTSTSAFTGLITANGGLTSVGTAIVDRPSSSAGYGILELDDQTSTRKFQAVFVGSTAGTVYGATAGNVVLDTSSGVSMTLSTADTARVVIGTSGNVSVNSPGSGVAFAATGIASQYAALFTAGGSAGTQKGLSVLTTTQNSADKIFNVNNSVSNLCDIFGDGHGDLGPNLSWTTAGAWSIGAPSSGSVALAVTGVTASAAVTIAAGGGGQDAVQIRNTAGSSAYALYVAGGTSSSDYCASFNNAAQTVTWFRVRGDGVVLGNDGTNLFELGYKDTPINTPGGSYTLLASDRGKTIVASSTAVITAPNSVFSPGAVITVLIGSGASCTIAQGAGLTLQWAGNGSTTGSRTLTGSGIATIIYVSASVALISGAGLS